MGLLNRKAGREANANVRSVSEMWSVTGFGDSISVSSLARAVGSLVAFAIFLRPRRCMFFQSANFHWLSILADIMKRKNKMTRIRMTIMLAIMTMTEDCYNHTWLSRQNQGVV